jgi:tetratricopeptide (TPR) repeat protein
VFDSAVEVYLKIINEEPETDVDRVIKSNTLATMKDYEATIKFCEDNEDRDEIFTHLQITKAAAYKNQGKLVKALEIFAQVQRKYDEEGSRDIYVLREISKICEKLGDGKKALIFYQRILKFDGEDKEILVKVVHLLKKSHRLDELFSYLERMHRLWPSNNNFTMEYANALMEKNEHPQAFAYSIVKLLLLGQSLCIRSR